MVDLNYISFKVPGIESVGYLKQYWDNGMNIDEVST